jgi:hypothetical protein
MTLIIPIQGIFRRDDLFSIHPNPVVALLAFIEFLTAFHPFYQYFDRSGGTP